MSHCVALKHLLPVKLSYEAYKKKKQYLCTSVYFFTDSLLVIMEMFLHSGKYNMCSVYSMMNNQNWL